MSSDGEDSARAGIIETVVLGVVATITVVATRSADAVPVVVASVALAMRRRQGRPRR